MDDNLILKVKNLSVNFNGEKIIEDVSFDLKEKENLIIVGPNGAGKTVLLRALINAVVFSGKIEWKNGIKISYIPQKLFFDKEIPLSAEEFFRLKQVSIENVLTALKSVGLEDKDILKKKIGELSAGQFQRVMVAWGLVDNPDVLLFDEPTSGIDIGGEETIYNLLEKVEKEINLTIIMITHDLNVVYKFADNVLCLNKNLVCYGPPEEALSSSSLNKLYKGTVKFYEHQHDNNG